MRKADYYPPHLRPQISGCVTFQGEDHEEENRKKRQAEEQKNYLLMQMEEKKQKKALEHKVNMLYDKQRIEMT